MHESEHDLEATMYPAYGTHHYPANPESIWMITMAGPEISPDYPYVTQISPNPLIF